MEYLKEKLESRSYQIVENQGKLFVDNSYIIEISILGQNSIIVCDTIFLNKKYETYLISLKENKFPESLFLSLIRVLPSPSSL